MAVIIIVINILHLPYHKTANAGAKYKWKKKGPFRLPTASRYLNLIRILKRWKFKYN